MTGVGCMCHLKLLIFLLCRKRKPKNTSHMQRLHTIETHVWSLYLKGNTFSEPSVYGFKLCSFPWFLGVEPKIEVGPNPPKLMVKIMVPKPYEQMDDLGVPLFLETPNWVLKSIVFDQSRWHNSQNVLISFYILLL